MTQSPAEGPMLDQAALVAVLSTYSGRKIIWGLLGLAGLFRQPFSTDLRQTDFACGSLNIGLALYADCLLASPDLTAMMTKEQANDDRHALARKRDSDARSDQPGGSSNPGSGGSSSTALGGDPADPFFDRLGFGRAGEARGD